MFLTGLNRTTVENSGKMDVFDRCFCGGGVVVRWCFCGGVVVFLWWCFGVFLVVWWCPESGREGFFQEKRCH